MAATNFYIKRILLIFVFLILLLVLLVIGWLVVVANTEELYGYVDKTGRFVIPPKYFLAADFKSGKAQVLSLIQDSPACTKAHDEVINVKGQSTGEGPPPGYNETCLDIHFDFERDIPYETGIKDFEYIIDSEYVERGAKAYGYTNKNGKWHMSPMFSRAMQINDGVSWVVPIESDREIWGLINKKGEYVLPPKCLSAGEFHDGLARCRVPVLFGRFY